MCACRADVQALLSCHAAHVGAQLHELRFDVGRGVAHGRRDLEHRLHQLGVDPRLELVPLHRCEDGVDVLDEVERLAVEEHVLLFDAERVGVALSECVIEDAAARRETAALARDRCRVDLLHEITASSSTSTSQRGSSSPTTIPVQAGRISANTSPCARITAGAYPASVISTRVRTTSAMLAPASRRAASAISRHRRICPYGSAGGSASSGMIGAVPATWTCAPVTTARM